MGLPKKGSRKIIVGEITYHYLISGNDGTIDLIIERFDHNSQRLITTFSYFNREGAIQITPKIVKQTIHYGIKNGWTPNQKGKEIRLNGIEDKLEW